jgi:protein-S-isoprenylcysteine O-methyltransferase Ste14
MPKSAVIGDYTVMVLAAALGGGSIVLLAMSDLVRPVQLGFSETRALLWDGFLSCAFFLQHSGMVRKAFRARMAPFIPPRYHRAIYSIASGVVLTLVVVLWQPSSVHLITLQGLPLWIARGCSVLAVLTFAGSIYALRSFDPFGLRPIKAGMWGESEQPSPFVIRGPYRWVRHPLYFCVLVLFWMNPDLTSDRLLFNVLWTIWVFVATTLEESDLLAEFGDTYREYQRKVPMLIPWRGRVTLSQPHPVQRAVAGRPKK